MRAEFPESIRHRFRVAGWFPGRRVPVTNTIPADHPAVEILATLSGLTVTPNHVAGEECAANDMSFCEIEANEEIEEWAVRLGTRLVGIAEVHYGHGELYIATDGRCFGRSTVHDAFYFEGASFAEAVERALLGRRSRPLLRPDQASVTLYGIDFNTDSSEVYRY